MSVEPQIIATNDSLTTGSGREDVVRHWMERLENRVRNFPEESILISFLVGGLLQNWRHSSVATEFLAIDAGAGYPDSFWLCDVAAVSIFCCAR